MFPSQAGSKYWPPYVCLSKSSPFEGVSRTLATYHGLTALTVCLSAFTSLILWSCHIHHLSLLLIPISILPIRRVSITLTTPLRLKRTSKPGNTLLLCGGMRCSIDEMTGFAIHSGTTEQIIAASSTSQPHTMMSTMTSSDCLMRSTTALSPCQALQAAERGSTATKDLGPQPRVRRGRCTDSEFWG